jgi:TrmH family RNA methyltransferase
MSEVLPLKISSKDNPKFKTLLSLMESKGRKRTGLFLVEGIREIERALASGYKLDHWTVADTEKGDEAIGIISRLTSAQCYSLSQPLFKQLAYRDEAVNAVAAFQIEQKSIQEISLPENPLCAPEITFSEKSFMCAKTFLIPGLMSSPSTKIGSAEKSRRAV